MALIAFPTLYASNLSDRGFLVGVQGGYGDTHWDNLPGVSQHDGFAARGFIGYDFNRYFGSELGYLHLPKATQGSRETTNKIGDLFAKLYSPAYHDFKLYAKAGLDYFYNKGNTSSRDHIAPAFGAGLLYEFNAHWALDASWVRYGGDAKEGPNYQPNPDVFLLGLSYKFPIGL